MNELFDKLNKLGISLNAKGENIEILDPKNQISIELIEEVKRNKKNLLRMLNDIHIRSKEIRIPLTEKKEAYALSSAQNRLNFINEFNKNSTLYNVYEVLEIFGQINFEAFQKAINHLILCHDSLRTSIISYGYGFRQKINTNVQLDIIKLQLGSNSIDEVIRSFIKPFDLTIAPLFRIGLLPISDEYHIMVIDMHHIITDGVSTDIIIKDFISFYKGVPVVNHEITYKDYSEWQKSAAFEKAIEKQKKWWVNEFEGDPPILNLPVDFSRPLVITHSGKVIRYELDKEITLGLKGVARNNSASLFTVLLGAFSILLSKLSNASELVVGVPTAGRRNSQLEKIIGMFVNTLPFKITIDAESDYITFLLWLKNKSLEIFNNQDYQIEDLINELKLPRDTSRNPLFNVMLVFQNFDLAEIEIPELRIKQYKSFEISTTSKVDFSIIAQENNEKLILDFEYSTALFKKETIERFVGYFNNLVVALIENKSCRISEIEILSEKEKCQLLYEFNNTNAEYPKDKTIIELFEDSVLRNASNTATIFKDEKLTYVEFNRRVNQLTNYIKSKGVKRGDVIGFLSERSADMMVGIFAILKSGGVYLPIDPNYPEERIAYIVNNSGTKLILSQERHKELSPASVDCLLLEDRQIVLSSDQVNEIACSPGDLMYIIYTSGSTGKPKGVMIEHQPLVNRINWMNSAYPINENDVIIQKTTIVFDVSIWELFWWSITGASLFVLNPQEEKDPQRIVEAIYTNKVSVIHFVPSMLHAFLEELDDEQKCEEIKTLKYVFSSGEALSKNLVTIFNRKLLNSNHTKLINLYGPTEATVDVTYFNCFTQDSYELIPIGKPIDNIKLYIVDRDNRLVALGVSGELCISGVGLAKGYINADILTNEKFVANPNQPGERMYKTGDLARWMPDGNIEYLGRIDSQVKIRGFRIELGEIENQLVLHGQINESVVIVKENDHDKVLVAYYVSEKEIDIAELRNFLSGKLPDYMIPSYFINLESIPVTLNGKLNRRALPDPVINLSGDFIAPSNKTEQKLVDIWSDTLKVDKVLISVTKNFFELGGHSILAIRLINHIQKVFGVKIDLPNVFNNPTVKGLSKFVEDSCETEEALPEITIDRENWYKPFHLTDIQQAYWIGRKDLFEFGNIGTHLYSELYIETLDVERLNKALQTLIERHGMLRMVIAEDGKQRILEEVPKYEVKVLDLRTKSNKEGDELFYKTRNELSHQVFSGEEWPLFDIRVTIFQDGACKIHYSMDALIMDAGSTIIFYEEFIKLYFSPDVQLPENKITFRDYLISEHKLQGTKLFNKSKKYWLDRINTIPLAPELPIITTSQTVNKINFERRRSYLDNEQWDRLKIGAKKLEVTPTVLFIACFSEVLYQWSKSSLFTLNLTFFNRIPFHPDVNRIIGDFTSLILLEIDYRERKAFINRIKDIQKRMWADLENHSYSGVEVLREMSKARGTTIIMPVVVTSTLGLNIIKDERFIKQSAQMSEDDKKNPFSISQTPQVWIDFQISEDSNGILYSWDSVEGLFPKGILDDMFESFENLLKSLITDSEVSKSKSVVLLPRSQEWLRSTINSTAEAISNKLLHELFSDQVKARESAIAIETTDQNFTYGELNHMSNMVGRRLRDMGAVPNKLVAVVMEKCWEQVVGSMGILYSGAAYLPIDADLPQDRIHLLLEQGEAGIVVTTQNVLERVSFPANKRILLIDKKLLLSENIQIERIQNPNDIAYVIFTSGSTGIPKGVIIDHKGAVNTILDINSRFNVSENDKVLALSSLSFDLSVYDIFGLLGAGGSIVIPKHEEAKNPEIWQQYVIQHSITLWNTVPALMQMLVEYVEKNRHGIDSLRLVLMSGDWIPLKLPERIKNLNENAEVISLGGATEASIWSIWYRVDEINPIWKSIPYGKPLMNQRFYVLKPDLSQCPDHVPGELYIGGIGLALGYWKDEIKTDRSFIVHPETKERLYRTGDMGRYFPDGNIEFLGREDTQVKIQGYRIELGEVESALKLYNSIDDAIVIASGEKGDAKELIAYVIPKKDITKKDRSNEDNIGELRDSGNTIIDKYERTLFKLNKHGIRKVENPLSQVQLLKPDDGFLTISCKSNECPAFVKEIIGFKEFCEIFNCLLPSEIEGLPLPKYYYPSAGSLYPVQTYVCVKPERIKGVEGGYYYYNPQNHCLELLNVYDNLELSEADNTLVHHAFTLHFISDLNAIRPMYGFYSEVFSHQEAGYMANLLINSYYQRIGIRSNITVDTNELFKSFKLSSDHLYLYSFAGGIGVEKGGDNQIQSQETKSLIKTPEQDKVIRISYIERKSYREFRGKELISQKELNFILSKIIPDGIAGSFDQRMIKLFLYVKEDRIEGLSKGVYRINPFKRSVELLNSEVDGKPIFNGSESIYDSSGFAIILTADRVINDNRKDILFLTGYVGQNIMNISTKHQIGLCAIGTVNQSYSKGVLKLLNDEEVLHSFLGGRVLNEQIEKIEQVNESNNLHEMLEQLKRFLKLHIPVYMIPNHFVLLERFPLTFNGKIDRKALPDPIMNIGRNYVAPSNENEERLTELWSEELDLKKEIVSVNTSFFELGGNSINAIKIINRIKNEFKVEIKLRNFYDDPTIKGISEVIETINFNLEKQVDNQKFEEVIL